MYKDIFDIILKIETTRCSKQKTAQCIKIQLHMAEQLVGINSQGIGWQDVVSGFASKYGWSRSEGNADRIGRVMGCWSRW